MGKKKSEIRPLGLFAVHVLNALSWDEAGKGYCMEFLCAGGHVLCKEALNVIPITHKTKGTRIPIKGVRLLQLSI